MLRPTVAMSQRAFRRGVVAGTCTLAAPVRANLVTHRAPRRMVSTKANGDDHYDISLDDALKGIMSREKYEDWKNAPRRPPASAVSLPRSIADRAGLTLTQTDFERIMGTNDLVGVEYLEQGMRAAAAVARILILDPDTGKRGYATGFLVAPRLLLTNRHVLPNVEVARASMAEFRYEYDVSGLTKPTEIFRLAPDEVYIVGDAGNKDADFALVAVAPFAERSRLPLSTFGYLRLDDQPGKVAENEFITIIQHPGGRHKQIALRENEVVAKGSNDTRPVLLYRSDTAPGSSGSPCFNDQWQVVALHSRGVPKTEDGKLLTRSTTSTARDSMSKMGLSADDLAYEANLGVRISFIVQSIRQAQRRLPQQLATDFLTDIHRGGPPVVKSEIGQRAATRGFDMRTSHLALDKEAEEIVFEDFAAYAGGFDAKFLDGNNVPLPEITERARLFGAVLRLNGENELKYPHFSVIMNKDRRLAFVSACNIDGAKKISYTKRPKFFPDNRIEASYQTDDYLYYEPGSDDDEFFDRGHLTRRDDVTWGDKEREAKAASDASFAFTNISPQHKAFNQSQRGGVWGQLENFVLDRAVEEESKASVFNGPIFNFTDLYYKQVPIPKEFFKIVVVPAAEGGIRTTAYIASQANLVADEVLVALAEKLGVPRPYAKDRGSSNNRRVVDNSRPRGIDVWQVTIEEIESLTGLQFNPAMRESDALGGSDVFVQEELAEESFTFPRKRLSSLDDVIL